MGIGLVDAACGKKKKSVGIGMIWQMSHVAQSCCGLSCIHHNQRLRFFGLRITCRFSIESSVLPSYLTRPHCAFGQTSFLEFGKVIIKFWIVVHKIVKCLELCHLVGIPTYGKAAF